MKPIQRFFRLLKFDKKDISYIYLYAIFGGLIDLTLPLGIQAIIGLIAGGSISSSWLILVTVVAAGIAFSGLLKIMQLSVSEVIQQRIFTNSAFDLAYRLPRLKLEALSKEYAPELVNRFFDTLTIQKGLPKILMDFSTAVLQIVFGLLLLSFYHPFFILFGAFLIAILLFIFWLTGPKGLYSSLKESKYKYEVVYWLEELARSMGTFKLAGTSNLPLQKTDGLVHGYLTARKAHFRILITQFSSIVAFKVTVTAGLLILGSVLVIDNRINLGQFVAAEIVVILIMASVEKLILSMETIYDVLTALEKLGYLTDMPVEEQTGLHFEDLHAEKGFAIELKNISYTFPDSRQPTLDGVNLSISQGEKICLAGYNGSGKSTLLHIITGLYTTYEGVITINGVPMNNLNAESIRAHIGDHMPQEDIFRGTVIENISMGHQQVSMQDVISAVRTVGLEDFIHHLPEGYQTVLLPGGKNLPRSIVSKMILARSFASQPALLAMEEPFSFLEKNDRNHIAGLLTSPDQPWTLIVVTDDPVIAMMCNRIIIMDKGRIVEMGTYAQLMASAHFQNVFKTTQEGLPPKRKATR
jgi:ABC-type bacteriocin/lantibiotic exporter with double-glycine peptidase domain